MHAPERLCVRRRDASPAGGRSLVSQRGGRSRDRRPRSDERRTDDPRTLRNEEEQLQAYTVKVKVVDTDTNPLEDAKVTLYSEPKEALTDSNGEVTFNDIEEGEHRLVVNYKGQTGEQNLNLKGDVEVFDFTIQIKPTNPLTSPLVLTIIGILVLVIITLYIRMQRMKKEK